jgi:hypothetical protein
MLGAGRLERILLTLLRVALAHMDHEVAID